MRNPTSAFKFAIRKSTSYESFFKNSHSNVVKRMGVFMQKYNYETLDIGVEMVKNGYVSDN